VANEIASCWVLPIQGHSPRTSTVLERAFPSFQVICEVLADVFSSYFVLYAFLFRIIFRLLKPSL